MSQSFHDLGCGAQGLYHPRGPAKGQSKKRLAEADIPTASVSVYSLSSTLQPRREHG